MSLTRATTWAHRLGWSVMGVLTVYLVSLAAMFVVMHQPPERFAQIMAYVPMPVMIVVPFEPMWNVARGGAAHVGEMAPDFTLPTVDRKAQVNLASFRGKRPVALVFGSYT